MKVLPHMRGASTKQHLNYKSLYRKRSFNMEIIWPAPIRTKLFSFHSKHFTPEETRRYIEVLIVRTEEILLNETVSVRYMEVIGKYKGISRIVIDRFKIYYKRTNTERIIVGIKFPREN